MTSRLSLGAVVVAAAFLLTPAEPVVVAQAPAPAPTFSLDQVLAFPFPDNLVASPKGSMIAWTFNERGARNIYVAEGPDFKARKVTPYQGDEGQEITSLKFTPDGKTIVYVRGGDHGANWPAEGNLPPNPDSSTTAPKTQIWSVATTGAALPKLLADGDQPAVSPAGNRVAFVRDRRIYLVPIDGSRPAEPAFFARGSSESPVWDGAGERLAFVSNRDDHSFIGIFTDATQPIRYLSTTTSRDDSPVWSLDAGREVLFVRMPGRGGTPRSPLAPRPQPWSIMIVNANEPWPPGTAPGTPFQSWKSGTRLVDSIPRFAGGTNIQWAADDHVIFSSYQDGWPHLYSIQHPGEGGAPKLLTPGPFMVEHVTLTPDGRSLIYSANTGAEAADLDRRHLFKVPVNGASAPVPLTSGTGLEWAPVVTADGQTLAYLQSTPQRSPLPAVMPMAGGPPRVIAADRLPPTFPASRLVTPEPVVFTTPDGMQLHAQLFKSTVGGRRRPALLYVHGGPQRQMLLGFHYMDYYANDYAVNQYLASRGFIVLALNYRLGLGYGHAFHFPENAGARGASEYLDVLAAAKLLQSRGDVDPARIGIWGGSYGGYLTALALGRNSDIFAAGVDIHGVHNWDRQGGAAPDLKSALAEDGITDADLKKAARVTFESSPVSSVATWKSPVLLIHGDDDRNVEFHQTVDLEQRLLERGLQVESLVIPDDIHDFLRFESWKTVATAAGEFLERQLLKPRAGSQ
ncbi:MAG: prolyl oligopeptidase family serine peptidase [Vicinamibacterales bacterium]